jgi:hypothetical protein
VFFRKGAAYGIAILKNNFVLAALVGRRLQPALLRRGKNSSLPKNILRNSPLSGGQKVRRKGKTIHALFSPDGTGNRPASERPAKN